MKTHRIIHSLLATKFVRVVLLALSYIGFGQLGLLLAVPPGYATIIWPASGIAIGALILYGPRLWPGVYIGSLIINLMIGAQLDMTSLVSSNVIAFGSTLQAIIGYKLVKTVYGYPIQLDRFTHILKLLFLIGPIVCLVAAPIGVTALYTAGKINIDQIANNILTWWGGDVLGVLVFAPLMLFLPKAKQKIKWNGRYVPSLPAFALFVLLVPLGLTFYTWKITSGVVYEDTYSLFKSMASEGRRTLGGRLNTYDSLLQGAGAFINSSNEVTEAEWDVYIDTVKMQKKFPGIIGLGYISADQVKNQKKTSKTIRLLKSRHPELKPIINKQFEQTEVIETLYLSQDTGELAFSDRIQDGVSQGSVFWLVSPLYKPGHSVNTELDRKKAIKGWVFAPFYAQSLLVDLNRGQNLRGLHLEVYEGDTTDKDALIFDDMGTEDYEDLNPPAFVYQQKISSRQKIWTLLWKSTSGFEIRHQNNYPLILLIGGLLFTALFGVYVVSMTVRNLDDTHIMPSKLHFIIPIGIFVVTCGLSFYLYDTLTQRELSYVKNIISEEIDKVERLVQVQAGEKLTALKRMGQRWEASGGTEYNEWQSDAKNYINDIGGLTTVEWVDSSYRIQWIEPKEGNEAAVGLDVLFNEERRRALEGAALRRGVTLTPPIDLVQGYKGFIGYVPLYVENKFNGFIAGIFSVKGFFDKIATSDISEKYYISLKYEDEEVFSNASVVNELLSDIELSGGFSILNRDWTLTVRPTRQFIQAEKSQLPFIVFFATLLSGFLISLTVRYIMISRLKSISLEKSEKQFRTAMENASIGMALVSPGGQWLTVNKALCDLLGYAEEELLEVDFQTITHPDDLNDDLGFIQKLLDDEIDTYQMEKRYFHKDGAVIWTLLSVSAVRDGDNKVKYFVSQIQDITARKQMDQMKSEFISIVSHELRTPLTSIRASLGLMESGVAGKLPQKAKELISIAYKNCERLILLINDILDLDKITAGKMRFDLQDLLLKDLVEQGIKENAGYAEKHNVKFSVKDIPAEVVVNVDPSRWQQVFSNLLSNAAKFSQENEKISIYTRVHHGMVRLHVQDYGSGIPDEFKSQIFQKFSQADSTSTRVKGGTGLGLHISKQIVETMRGQIGFETEKDKGTTFWVDFPIVLGGDPIDHDDDVLQVADRQEINGQKPSVLFVEDNEDFVDVTMRALDEEMSFVAATTIAEATAKLKQQKFSLAIIDIEMPDGKGWQLVDYIRGRLNDQDMPILVLTAYDPPEFIRDKVSSIMVKTRNSESAVREKIIELATGKEQEKE